MVFRVAANTTAVSPSFVGGAYGMFHQDGTTTLTADISNNSTTAIQVDSTSGFPSSGYILIENEIIQYTTTTATTFDGTITRGVLGTTNVAHTAGVAITEVQGTGSGSTSGTLKFNNTDFSSGVDVDGVDITKIVFSTPGIYNVQISGQLLNFTASIDNVTIWFALDGSDIPASASVISVPAIHGQKPGTAILAVNILVSVLVNQYMQIKFATDSGDTVVATYPAGTSPVHPTSPAIILTAQQLA